jgi:hypothetical protein
MGIRNKRDKGRIPLCFGGQNVQHISSSCSETIQRRPKFLNKRRLNMNEKVASKKTLRCAKKALATDLGTDLERVKSKWFNTMKYLQRICYLMPKRLPP